MKNTNLNLIVVGMLLASASSTLSAESALPASTSSELVSSMVQSLDPQAKPGQNFDLSNWKITLPMMEEEGSRKGKAAEIQKDKLSEYEHPEWFYTDKETGAMVFKAPNTAPTTPNSKNARSELRAMLADHYGEPKNNFVVVSHPQADEYGSIGGRLKATLAVDWVSTSGDYKKNGAFATVIGQIHGSKNEPLKIIYRKLPEHNLGSLSWNYELNPPLEQQKSKLRKDIRHDVFGQHNLRQGDPEPLDGIALDEVFSYEVIVEGDMMTLNFVKSPGLDNEETKSVTIDLTAGQYQGHEIDQGYGSDWMYFKAGSYNQCNTGSSGCAYGGPDSEDYAQVRFYELVLDQ